MPISEGHLCGWAGQGLGQVIPCILSLCPCAPITHTTVFLNNEIGKMQNSSNIKIFLRVYRDCLQRIENWTKFKKVQKYGMYIKYW